MNAPLCKRCTPSEWTWIGIDEGAVWDAAVEAVGGDVFHRAWFHELARVRGEGTPRLFLFRSANVLVVLPLLLRPIPKSDDFDATSVYGYVGPVSLGAGTQADVVAFQDALCSSLAIQGVVSVFSRLHPLREQSPWLQGLGALEDDGTTVSIDLRVGTEQRRAMYRGSHRREIDRLRREGYEVQGEDGSVNEFHELYTAAMCRLGAGSRYAFGPDQLRMMTTQGGMRLIVVRKDDEVAAAGLFTRGGPGSHYFLSGTDPRHRKMAPSKLMIDEACEWAREWGARWMHLGGGVGGASDALFRFKSGFGPRRHGFRTWRWILDRHAYRSHCVRRDRAIGGTFFPAYRAE